MTDWLKKAEESLDDLIATDRQLAELRVKWERDKRKAKRTWSAILLRSEGSVEAKKAQAETHEQYRTAEAAEMTSLLEYEALKGRRDTNRLVIEFWKSYQKAVREGEV